jgi:hypothetical protein
MDEKICPICKIRFCKPNKYSYKQWNNRVYCSSICNHNDKTYIEKLRIASIKNGNIPPNQTGKKRSIESRIKMMKPKSMEHRMNMSGEKSHLWKGGISHNPYTIDWTKTLKRSIRERDKYICQICGIEQCEETFAIHHIDYDKKNCNPINLITLCKKCHTGTNHNREKWIKYFNNLINNRKEQ